MNARKGRLKVALLVIGVLAVVFGMYGAFQVQEADGHTKSWTCVFAGGDIYGWSGWSTKSHPTGNTSSWYTNCGTSCHGNPNKWHVYEERQHYWYEYKYYVHTGESGYCHAHTYKRNKSGSPYWRLIPCGG